VLHKSYSSLNIVSVIKLIRMTWAKNVAHLGEIKNVNVILLGKSPDHLIDLGIDGEETTVICLERNLDNTESFLYHNISPVPRL
jgi:hypothetical protein